VAVLLILGLIALTLGCCAIFVIAIGAIFVSQRKKTIEEDRETRRGSLASRLSESGIAMEHVTKGSVLGISGSTRDEEGNVLPAGWRRHFDGEEDLSYYTDAKVRVVALFAYAVRYYSYSTVHHASLSHEFSCSLLAHSCFALPPVPRRANAPPRGPGRKRLSSRSSATPRPGTAQRTGETCAAAVSTRTGRRFARNWVSDILLPLHSTRILLTV